MSKVPLRRGPRSTIPMGTQTLFTMLQLQVERRGLSQVFSEGS